MYYQPRGMSEETLLLMQLICEQCTWTPFYGIRRMTAWLRRQGCRVNHKRVARLMETMGLETIYPKPKTSQPSTENRVYPYLLRNVAISSPDQVWSTDITYIRIRDYQTAPAAIANLGDYFQFYNSERLHQSLGYRTPKAVYRGLAG